MKVYIAAPLFNEGERAFNEKIEAIIRECDHETSMILTIFGGAITLAVHKRKK